jgi:hypothetical protein
VSGWNTNRRMGVLCSLNVLSLGSSSSYASFVHLAACRRLAMFPLSQHSIRLLAFWNAATVVLTKPITFLPS